MPTDHERETLEKCYRLFLAFALMKLIGICFISIWIGSTALLLFLAETLLGDSMSGTAGVAASLIGAGLWFVCLLFVFHKTIRRYRDPILACIRHFFLRKESSFSS